MLIAGLLCLAATYITGHWIGGLALAVLLWLWYMLRPAEGPPVLALAMTYQWVQVSIGVYYTAIVGPPLLAHLETDWERMVLVGLGCVVALTAGLKYGIRLIEHRLKQPDNAPPFAFPVPALVAAYFISVATTGALQEFAWDHPSLTQGILAVSLSHLGLLFLLLRRFSRPTFNWRWIIGLLAFEVGLGFTGYFAGFREPLVMGFVMVTEVFDRRESRHWVMMAAVLALLVGSSVLWMSVRGQYREDFADELSESTRVERFDRIRSLAAGIDQSREGFGNTLYALVDRVWAVYYPAKALERVPTFLPYENGRIIGAALVHLVTPRVLFPDKGTLPSDSEMVRKYSDVNVAGAERDTSIAFGYAAESYVDFGLPWMFIPVLIYGLLAGMAYRAALHFVRHRELAIALTTVVFWMSLYLFERSWVKTLGLVVTLLIYLGGVTYLIDAYLMGRRAKTLADLGPSPLLDATR
jgi:hypothetical protein